LTVAAVTASIPTEGCLTRSRCDAERQRLQSAVGGVNTFVVKCTDVLKAVTVTLMMEAAQFFAVVNNLATQYVHGVPSQKTSALLS
jgi:Na+/melibiose symporter-like transporter